MNQEQFRPAWLIENIEDMLQFYEVPLGEGTFGKVLKAVIRQTQEKVAVKQVSLPPIERDSVMNEVMHLERIVGDHIITYKGSYFDEEDQTLNVIMELGQDNLRTVMNNKLFAEEQLLNFIVQIVSAFLQLSNKKLMHLDLKPENILITRQNYYKLCDFGCSQSTPKSILSHYNTNAFGTFNYLAPEVSSNYIGHFTKSSADVWSFGVILYEMMYGKLPFHVGKDNRILRSDLHDFFQKKLQIEYPFTSRAYPQIIALIKKMLHPDPQQRIQWKPLKQLLIEKYNVSKHVFEMVSIMADRHLTLLKVFLTMVVLIRENVKHSALPFYSKKSNILSGFADNLVRLSSIYSNQFRKIFQYKWLNLEPSTKQFLNTIDKHLREEINNSGLLNTEQISWNDQSLLENYEEKVKNQAKTILQHTDTELCKWESVKTITLFCEEALESLEYHRSLFCMGNYASFGKTMAALRIIPL